MGIIEAFEKEDRVELKVSQLITILDERAKEKAEKDVILKLCKSGRITAPQIYNIFNKTQEEKASE